MQCSQNMCLCEGAPECGVCACLTSALHCMCCPSYLLHVSHSSSNNCVDSIGRCVLYVQIADTKRAPMCVGT